MTIAGQKVTARKLRVLCSDGRGEAELDNYALLQPAEAMPEATLRRMVHGVSCRRYELVVDLAQAAFGAKKSSVGRGFVRASAEQLQQLAQRRLDDDRFAVIFVDAEPNAGEMISVALGMTTCGEKRLLGLRHGLSLGGVVRVDDTLWALRTDRTRELVNAVNPAL